MAITRIIDKETIRIEIEPEIHWWQQNENAYMDEARQIMKDIISAPGEAKDYLKEVEDALYDNDDITVDADLNIDYDATNSEVTCKYLYQQDGGSQHESLIEALSNEMDLDIPSHKFYSYLYKRLGDTIQSHGLVDTFEELVEQAYINPYEFTCADMNDEEYAFIQAVIAYKVAEKLQS